MRDRAIVKCVIHPAIGIARVGNSPDGWFIGPEVPGVVPKPKGGFKDAQGRIKRQVARFRIYGLNAAGKVVKELTADDAAIDWAVHVANKKAAWYTFDVPMDIPQATESSRRNAHIVGDRTPLVIDPGPRSISGRNAQGQLFDSGRFFGIKVLLGELRTDEQGNLLVFGGFGQSDTVITTNSAATYANNDGWYDDTSDGPVQATVTIDGKDIPVTSAWVIVGPPDFAPAVQSVVTLYDVVLQAATELGKSAPDKPSFTRDIYPIFRRFCIMEWVNEGFYMAFGHGSDDHFLDPERLKELANNGPNFAALRQRVFSQFRNPNYRRMQSGRWPPLYGDAMHTPPMHTRQWLALTPLQYSALGKWAAGNFIADWKPNARQRTRLTQIPLADRPRALDRAALEPCLGGPFHPGCEATWPMRQALLYDAPLRIKPRAADAFQDYGDSLSRELALIKLGPLDGSGPGDLTRWMGVPWQADTASCGAGYTAGENSSLPTFWPARVPNHVLRERSYAIVMDERVGVAQRMKYFSLREDWLREFSTDPQDRINGFLAEWHKLGIIVREPGPRDVGGFPADIFVERENEFERRPDGRHLLRDPRTGW